MESSIHFHIQNKAVACINYTDLVLYRFVVFSHTTYNSCSDVGHGPDCTNLNDFAWFFFGITLLNLHSEITLTGLREPHGTPGNQFQVGCVQARQAPFLLCLHSSPSRFFKCCLSMFLGGHNLAVLKAHSWLSSKVTPGCIWGTIWGARALTRVSGQELIHLLLAHFIISFISLKCLTATKKNMHCIHFITVVHVLQIKS